MKLKRTVSEEGRAYEIVDVPKNASGPVLRSCRNIPDRAPMFCQGWGADWHECRIDEPYCLWIGDGIKFQDMDFKAMIDSLIGNERCDCGHV